MSSYGYSYTYNDDNIGAAVALWLVYLLVVIGLSIAMYVFRAAGCHSIAKRRGIKKPWLAWIPVADAYLLGCISDQYQYVVKGRNKSKRKVLLVLNIVLAVLYAVLLVCYIAVIINVVTGLLNGADEDQLVMGLMGPLMGILGMCLPVVGVAIAVMVLRYMALYDLYTSCSPSTNVLFLVLSIIFGVTEPFFIFFNRKKDGGMPPRRPEPQAYAPLPEQQPQYQPPQEPWDRSDIQ